MGCICSSLHMWCTGLCYQFLYVWQLKAAALMKKTAGYYLGTIYGVLFLAGRFIGTALTKFSPQTNCLQLMQ